VPGEPIEHGMGSFLVRMRHGAPATVLVCVALAVWFGLRTGDTSGYVMRTALAIGALCWLAIGLALRARAWRIVDTPISKTCAATIGECEFSGAAQSPSPQTAPGSGIQCAWYKWKLQHYIYEGKSSHWRTEQELEFRQGFWLTDDTGSIWVDPVGADFDGFPENKLPVPDRAGRWRQLEWRLAQQAPTYVMGPVTSTPDGKLMVATSPGSDDDFLISDDSKRTVSRRLGGWAWASLVLGLIAVVFVPLLSKGQQHYNYKGEADGAPALHGSVRIAVLVGGIYCAVLGLSWLMRVYNRLVIVRNQAQKAWASIEVQEQRRHDLIDNLVAVVKQYAQYERTTQTDIAAARAHGSLPNDQEVAAATAQDAGAHAEGAKLVALAENYPDLHANEEFTKLSATLTDTENRIAFARQFYNDAVNVMRDRRGTMPYAFIAPLVPIPSLQLFGESPTPTAAPGSGIRTNA
jgi:LemA protein